MMEQHYITATPFISTEERVQLVRYCAAMSGRIEFAEDLAQEAFLEALQHQQALRDPSRRTQWLRGIARNVYLRWQRQQGHEQAHHSPVEMDRQGQDISKAEWLFVDDCNLEQDLERKELLELLQRALALLPLETRTALIQHYIEDAPLAQIAHDLGTNANALAVRLQRGKVALRRLLTQQMQQEFFAHRQLTEQIPWEVTPLWCYRCGKQRLLGQRIASEGVLLLKCPVCNPGEQQLLHRSQHPLLQGMNSYKPMLARLRNWSHEHYRAALAAYFEGKTINCEACRRPLIILFAPLECLPDWLQAVLRDWQWSDQTKLVNTFCPHCQKTCNTSLSGLALALPQAHAFARTQSRIRTLPVQSVETEGKPALLTRIESVTERASLTVISDEETYGVLRVEIEGC